jgi:hypothetical protein
MTSNQNKTMLFANIENQNFQIIILKNKNLLYYNNFEYQTKEDILYFLLFVIEQNKELSSETKLILLGYISKNDKTFTLISKFIKNIEIYEISKLSISDKVLNKTSIDYIIS